MKRLVLTVALMIAIVATGFSQDKPQVIKLDQTAGKFTVEQMTVSAGKYIFEVSNVGVDHELGFVLVPVKNGKEGEHIKASYLSKTIKDGETAKSKVVNLTPGTYSYFCPLNPTPHYTITVK